jgi:hypothetical protein
VSLVSLVDGTLVGEGSRVPCWRTAASPDWTSRSKRESDMINKGPPKIPFMARGLARVKPCPDAGLSSVSWLVGVETRTVGDEHRLALCIGMCFMSIWDDELGDAMSRGAKSCHVRNVGKIVPSPFNPTMTK